MPGGKPSRHGRLTLTLTVPILGGALGQKLWLEGNQGRSNQREIMTLAWFVETDNG
jgi:hypothetical protein